MIFQAASGTFTEACRHTGGGNTAPSLPVLRRVNFLTAQESGKFRRRQRQIQAKAELLRTCGHKKAVAGLEALSLSPTQRHTGTQDSESA